jgi:WD40 repeat protein
MAGALADPEQAQVIAHVEACADCRQALERLSETPDTVVERLRRADAVPPRTLPEVLQDLRDRPPSGPTVASGSAVEPATITFPGPPTSRGPLGQLADYHIEAELGRGTFGVVFKAFDERLARVVAIKVLRPEFAATGPDRARFEREGRAAAAVRHEHVVAIFHVGQTPGFFPPYLVMEYVEGESLAERLDRQGAVPPAEAAEVVRQAARGLAAAHQRGLVHRDVKPANLLQERGTGKVRVSDFGLARAVEGAEGRVTLPGSVVGTPAYMSPEQVQTPDTIDGRSDVYALGAVLYHALTGSPPFRGTTLMLLQQAVNQDPRPLRELDDRIPHDLENISLKCLSKEPQRRYGSANDLADDLARWQRGEPVRARPLSRLGRLVRWCRRNRAVAALLSAVVVALVSGTVVSVYFALLYRHESDRRQKALLEAEWNLHLAQIRGTQEAVEAGRINEARDLLRAQADREKRLAGEPRFLRGFDWYYWKRQCDGREARPVKSDDPTGKPFEHDAEVWAAAFDPDGRVVSATGEWGHPLTVRRWNPRKENKLPAPITRLETAHVYGLTLSPDARVLAAATGGYDSMRQEPFGEVLVLEVGGPERRFRINGPGSRCRAAAVCPSGDGWLVAAATDAMSVHVWEGGREPVKLDKTETHGEVVAVVLALSETGKRLAWGRSTASGENWLLAWELAGGRPVEPALVCPPHPDAQVTALAFSHDGAWLAAGGDRGTVLLCRPGADDKTSHRFRDPTRSFRVTALAFSREGGLLAAGGGDHAVRVWDLGTRRLLATLTGHDAPVSSVAFSADGRQLVSASWDRTVKLWDLFPDNLDTPPERHEGRLANLAFAPDGRLASGGADGKVRFWDARGKPLPELIDLEPKTARAAVALAFSPDGRLALTNGDVKGQILLRDRGSAISRKLGPPLNKEVYTLAVCPSDPDLLAIGDADGGVRLRSLKGGVGCMKEKAHDGAIYRVAFSRGGDLLATAGKDGFVRFWDRDLNLKGEWTGADGPVWCVDFSPTDDLLAVACNNASVLLLDVAHAERPTKVAELGRHSGRVTQVAFSADGRSLASAGQDRTVKLWGTYTHQLHATLRGHEDEIFALAFAPAIPGAARPSSPVLASGGRDGVLRLWRAADAEDSER